MIFAVEQKGEKMSNLISKRNAVVAIVNDAIRSISNGEKENTEEYQRSILDAVAIVLDTEISCVECKHFTPYKNGFQGSCDEQQRVCMNEDFCSWAEKARR